MVRARIHCLSSAHNSYASGVRGPKQIIRAILFVYYIDLREGGVHCVVEHEK
jgi:hypothetical protein